MSAQAVSGAVGRNPISVIIPCHRVVGTDGSLTGYGGEIYLEKSKAFKYYNYAGITTNSDYDKYVKGIKSISEYDTGILSKNREQLVTLSTCVYHTDDGRFVIVGTKIK